MNHRLYFIFAPKIQPLALLCGWAGLELTIVAQAGLILGAVLLPGCWYYSHLPLRLIYELENGSISSPSSMESKFVQPQMGEYLGLR